MCALYLCKNTTNSLTIMRTIESRATELVNQPGTTDLLDVLARTQALILYHIIRLWDGDVSVLAAVQNTAPAMDESARVLKRYLDGELSQQPATLETPSLSAAAIPPPSTTSTQEYLDLFSTPDAQFLPSLLSQNVALHQNWLLMESTRRTYLITFFFLQIYRMLVMQVSFTQATGMPCQSITVSSHLWDAPDSVAFASAWEGKKYFVWNGGNLYEGLLSLEGGDVDTFSKMLLTVALGIEQARGWLVGRGGSL